MSTTLARPAWVADPTADTVRTLALLAGAGAGSDDAVRWVAGGGTVGSRLRRSCLDGGSRLLVSVATPGRRRLGLHLRVPDADRPGVTRMAIWRWNGTVSTGWRNLYAGETVGTWADVRAAVTDPELTLAAWHHVLGPNGRIYSVGATGDGPAWVAWQLDPGVVIGRALAALGLDDAWPAADRVLAGLLGSRSPERAAPWSLAVATDGSRWRIGTSRWARDLEDAGKRRRFAVTVAGCGGDRSFAEGVYKVVAATGGGAYKMATARTEGQPVTAAAEVADMEVTAGAGGSARVGRAVEIEFELGPGRPVEPVAAEFFLAVPSPFGALDGRRP